MGTVKQINETRSPGTVLSVDSNDLGRNFRQHIEESKTVMKPSEKQHEFDHGSNLNNLTDLKSRKQE